MKNLENKSDLIVFSSNHFGSSEVRTSKLMSRFALRKRVYFIEAPIVGVTMESSYILKTSFHQVTIIQPYLPENTSVFEQKLALLNLVKNLINVESISHYMLWTDTPKGMAYIRKLNADSVIYDCLKTYSDICPELQEEMLQYADVVLTSGFLNQDYEALTSSESLPLNLSELILGENAYTQSSSQYA